MASSSMCHSHTTSDGYLIRKRYLVYSLCSGKGETKETHNKHNDTIINFIVDWLTRS